MGGGILHSLSFILSLLSFVVISVMLGYKTIFLAPVPLIVTFAIIFVAKAISDEDFKSWSLSHKAKHCLVASIFPISSPRPSQENSLDEVEGAGLTEKIKISGPELFF